MKIGIDNVSLPLKYETIDLSAYKSLNEKYVHAVDNLVEMLFTDNDKTAEYFTENGIVSYTVFKRDLS